ncbi:Uncharacterized protein FKW44_015702 [Caligus rogercresseyi]|uniref:Uncharacterized protein n=1 Tax=Caligus rogercresseyi TaxID=217165 RepID=A0A7T8H1E1_CALRO|nr:Uncharacterized protein FKW44_015702 [Caligus rogercresseyi]
MKAIEFAFLNSKALIAKRLSTYTELKPNEIRAIMLAAAARYTAFKLKISQEDNTNGTLAINRI